MSEKNQYLVRAYVDGLQEVGTGTRVSDYEFGIDQFDKKHFLSTVVTAENLTEAIREGKLKLNRVLSVFTIYTGTPYNINWINGSQISGKQPFQSLASRSFTIAPYFPVSKDKIEEIGKVVGIIDKLPNQDRSTKRVIKAVSYFQRGCYLQTKWNSEAFLNFYKVIELVSHDFRKHFDEKVSNQMKNTLLEKLTETELQELRTPKRLIQFTCEQLGTSYSCDISRIVELRNEFSAHASLKEVIVSQEEFDNCKKLAGEIIKKYVYYVQEIREKS